MGGVRSRNEGRTGVIAIALVTLSVFNFISGTGPETRDGAILVALAGGGRLELGRRSDRGARSGATTQGTAALSDDGPSASPTVAMDRHLKPLNEQVLKG